LTKARVIDNLPLRTVKTISSDIRFENYCCDEPDMNPAAFSPEYLEAVAAARWSWWLLPLFLLAPILAVFCRYHRLNIWLTLALLIVAAVGTWYSLWCYSEGIWTAMEKHASTAAELDEVTSDTGRVLGPFLFGIPFSTIYSLASYAFASLVQWVWNRARSVQQVRVAG
jgi:hypothetical protein